MAMRGPWRRGGERSGDSGNDLLTAQQFQQIGDSENPGQLAGVDANLEGLLNFHQHFHHSQGINTEILYESRVLLNTFWICSRDGMEKAS